jgi:hypothetical protein
MYEERVSIIEPALPESLIIVSPHLEQHVAEIAEKIAKNLDCYAVINHGWERANYVDFMNDKANCNSIKHLYHDVVKEEFLDPIFNFIAKIRKAQFINIYILILHGFTVPEKWNSADGINPPEIVLGYGAGSKRLSCSKWRRNAFIDFLNQQGFTVYLGKAGGKYAGANKDNLNQLFRINNPDYGVDEQIHSLQIEIENIWRYTLKNACLFAENTSKAIESLVDLGDEGFTQDFPTLPEY